MALLGSLVAAPVAAAPAPKGKPATDKAVFFASDGMRPDLVDRYVADGGMPTFASLITNGVKGQNGLTQAFPPNTGVGWYTLATGTWPGEHGSTNNTFFRTGESDFNNRTSLGASILQADTIQQAAERAGKTVVSVEWVGSRALVPALQGPVVDFRNFYSDRGILLNYDLPGQPAGATAFGVAYQKVGLDPADGWTNVPTSFSPAMQEQLKLTNTAFPANQNVNRFFDLYIYDATNDATTNYDHVLAVASTDGKNGNAAGANLSEGQWKDIKVTLPAVPAAGTTPAIPARTAGFYLKAIEIAPDLSQFRVYYTSISRLNASYNALGAVGSAAFEETLAHDFPTSTAADFAPMEAGIVDEDTYVEQGLLWKDAHFAYLHYIFDTLQIRPNLLMLGNPVTDEFKHQFLALVTPTDMDGDPNPYYDDATNDDVPDGRLAIREGYIRSAYEEADETLHLGRTLMGGNPTTVATSDHGFAPQWRAINAGKVLEGINVPGVGFLQGAAQTSNCRKAASGATYAKACWAGGTAQIYLNVAGRDSAGTAASGTRPAIVNTPQIPANQYNNVRNQIKAAFEALTDPDHPGKRVIDVVLMKEELSNVDGSDSLHPNRSGDLVVVSRPPYQFDAAAPDSVISFSQFFGQHGYLPNLVDLAHNVNMHGTFIASGPGIRHQDPVAGVRAIDVAPTLAYLLGIPGPQNARGKILVGLTTRPSFKTVTVLDVSDFHGQLVPLQEASDSFGPSFDIGGAAYLKPWFDAYRAEADGGSITVTSGDAVGATPPISSYFGDTPTIEMMNAMGFDADGLGNHNFDVSSAYLRNTLIPLARFPYLSANIVDANGKTPAEWSPSKVFNFEGVKVGLVGFSNEDIPALTRPGALDPFHVENRRARVQAEVNRLRSTGIKTIIVMGHDGADSGTVSNPVGPAVSLADSLTGVDALIGDHTNFQAVSLRPNKTLFAENLSKGVRFTRVRLIVDPSTKAVVYSTADFHKPWNIGTTADPAIQTEINRLNAILSPILSVVTGYSTRAIPRTDACGNTAGRICESLVGNVVADSMRAGNGADFALMNSGGLRSNLTCPTTDSATDFCPSNLYPFTSGLFPITDGQAITVLPFGNFLVKSSITGAQLKTALENGVDADVSATGLAANGQFPQISGLCFTYDINLAKGSRVTGAVRQAANGSCTGAAIPLTGAGSTTSYTIALNDFTASGGDGYPALPFVTDGTLLEAKARAYIGTNTPIAPSIQGRITCFDGNLAGTAPDCPVVTP